MSATAFRLSVVWLVCVLGLVRSSSADPVILYSNFGPHPGYIYDDPASRYTQSDTSAYVMGFELSASARLLTIRVPVVWGGQFPNGVYVWLLPSEGGVPVPPGPHCLVECWEFDVPSWAELGTPALLTAESNLRPLLEADTRYFLAVYARGPGYDVIHWPWNSAGVVGTYGSYDFFSGGFRLFTGTLGAFQIWGGDPAPVPEPATLLLVAAGAGTVLKRARRRSASR